VNALLVFLGALAVELLRQLLERLARRNPERSYNPRRRRR
jgi:hypothetical protein